MLHAETTNDPGYAGSTEASPEKDTGERFEPAKERSRTDHFRIGVIGGVGFPRPLAIEGMVKIEKTLGLGLEYSALPSLSVSGVDTSFHALAVDARFFPLQGPFFIGVRAGRQHLAGAGTLSARGMTAQGSMTVDTTFVNPRMGFLWTFEPGISIGFDAGAQIPVTSSVSSSLPDGAVVSDDALRVARIFGTNVVPTVDLIRLGFLL